ncbi:MAG: ABC transporter permease [Agathobacter sp.]|nr:ABC transporter permease [Agathobacter sp.]
MSKKGIKGIISFIVLAVVWQILCTAFSVNTALVPTPVQVIKALVQLIKEGLPGSLSRVTLVGHIGISLYRFVIGYVTAAVIAIILGLILGTYEKAFDFVNPIVQVIRPIAPVAFLPFIVLWFGIGNLPAIVIIFIAAFFPIFLSTASATQNINPIYIKVARNFGLSRNKTIFRIVFPAIFAQVANSLRLALGTAWIFLVSGEMVGAQSGLGFLIMDSKNCIRFDALLAIMLTIGVIGFILDFLMRFLEKLAKEKYGLGGA